MKVWVLVTMGALIGSLAFYASADYYTPIKIEAKQFVAAEMWNYTSGGVGYQFVITDADQYYNLTGLSLGYNNGFDYTDETQANGGSYLTAKTSGEYKMSFSMSFESVNAGGLYGFSIGHNWDQNTHRNCYARRTAASAVGSVSVVCTMDIDVNDNISIMVENENGDRDIWIHTANINLMRIGE